MKQLRPGLFALFLALWALLAPDRAAADDLEKVVQSGKLSWGADQEGGGPYIYPLIEDPDQVTGFEVDLAAKLAEQMGLQSNFVQGAWDALPDMLRAHKMDLVLNGYELTDTNQIAMTASMPYYVYGLQLLVRDDSPVKAWEDLCKAKADGSKPKLGALVGSAAEEYLREPEYDGPCEVIAYDGNTDAMREVETGKLDGTLQDTPIASFYGPQFPRLRKVGEPVGKGYYVIYVRKGEAALAERLNTAIKALLASGDLKTIYAHYGIWDDWQDELYDLAQIPRPAPPAPAPSEATGGPEISGSSGPAPEAEPVATVDLRRGWPIFVNFFPVLAKSAVVTVILSVLSFPIAIMVGLGVAVGRLYGPAWIAKPFTAYVEILRGTPLMLQLYFIFFFLPEVGINIPAFACAVMGLAINYSAYESEIYRAGLQAIPVGQMEAAESLGMSRALALRRIIVPQAFRIVIPPVVNDFIALFKDTSVCSVVTVMELTKRFSVLSRSTSATIEIMIMTGILYMAMSYPMSLLARNLEKRLEGGQR